MNRRQGGIRSTIVFDSSFCAKSNSSTSDKRYCLNRNGARIANSKKRKVPKSRDFGTSERKTMNGLATYGSWLTLEAFSLFAILLPLSLSSPTRFPFFPFVSPSFPRSCVSDQSFMWSLVRPRGGIWPLWFL